MHPVAMIRLGGAVNARVLGGAGPSTPERSLAEIASDLKAAAAGGARTAVLVGGEPTIRKNLRAVLSMPARLGMQVGLCTNGRMLAYGPVRRALIDANVRFVQVALHAADPAIHDALVGVPGAHSQTLQGLQALCAEASGLQIEVACTVVRSNAGSLESLVRMIAGLPGRCGLRIAAPIEADADWPPGGGVEAACAAVGLAQRSGLHVCWEGFPPCRMDPHGFLRDEVLRCSAPGWGPSEAGRAVAREEPQARLRPLSCCECVRGPTCPGAPAAFLQREGEQGLRPVRGLRANAFNFERLRELPGLTLRAGACGARSIDLGSEQDRLVIVCDGDSAALYRTDTADFTDREIREVKSELQQVYLDRHEQGTLCEFLQSVTRARMHPECVGCPERDRCCTALVLDPAVAFEQEEQWIRQELSGLRGRVLDVGCGEGLYRELVQALIDRGAIEYHGLDPDAAALAKMRDAGVGGTLHHGEIETFDPGSGAFDHVLALRSPNHFRDLRAAFSSLSRLTREQGQVVLCDSVVYGLLRTQAQAAFADRNAPRGHEHWRNLSSHEVVALAAQFPFRLDVHLPVTADRCNTWIVKLTRIAER